MESLKKFTNEIGDLKKTVERAKKCSDITSLNSVDKEIGARLRSLQIGVLSIAQDVHDEIENQRIKLRQK